MSFADDLSISVEIASEVEQAARAATLNILKFVVLATPVDTGRARGNWQTSVSKPINSQSDIVDKSGGSTISRGSNTVLQSRDYDVFYITNNLPYIEELNRGTSSQAPAKFVETAIKRVTRR
jgi:hypothetical protein